jgi:hypothetical protein
MSVERWPSASFYSQRGKVRDAWSGALARHRDGLSEGTFKYAVIDARFEDKGRSLYEGAILYAGNHAAITEEILNETAPTYHALKPKGTDFSLLTIHRARRPTRNPRPGGN